MSVAAGAQQSADRRSSRRIAAMELQLERSHHEPARFHGYTMLPLLREGDGVETGPVGWSQIRVGDVVTYRYLDRFPTRRVMSIDRDARVFVIKGDSIVGHPAYVVPFEDVLARVVRRRRNGTWLEATDIRWRARTRYELLADRVYGTSALRWTRDLRVRIGAWRRRPGTGAAA